MSRISRGLRRLGEWTRKPSPLSPYFKSSKADRIGDACEAGTALDVRLIEGSRLFNAQHYVNLLAAKQRDGLPPARHYALHGWRLGLNPGPLFNTADYLARNPDVAAAGVNPLVHYLRMGMQEGRAGWSEVNLMEWQRGLFERPDLALQETLVCSAPWPVLRQGDLVTIHAHSRGHFVFQQFQQMIGQAFGSAGIDCELADERRHSGGRQTTVRIVVAPHDFFFLDGAPEPNAPEFTNAILLNSEQMPSVWFAKALPYFMRAPNVLDMNVQTAACLSRLGVNARFLPLGYVPENEIFKLQASLPDEPIVRRLPPALAKPPAALDGAVEHRGIDVLLIGSNSERRERFVSENSGFFDSKTCFIHLAKIVGALKRTDPEAVSALAYAGLAQRSKILLNVHHFGIPYFEWQRLMHFGLMQCCCVVTERSSRVPGLVPGEHYFEDDLDKLRALMEWLLNDRDGRDRAETVRRAGYEAALSRFQLKHSLCELFQIDLPADPAHALLRGNT